MATLYDKYMREIKQYYDWNELVSDAKNNPVESFEGDTYGSVYLGSLINPSGKYYLPFACSNVDTCNHCHGTGLSQKTDPCGICDGRGYRAYTDMIKYGWEDITEFKKKTQPYDDNHFICLGCHGSGKVHRTCNQCGGMGSRDAYRDQEFYRALDTIAESYNGWIESGEGDPCDTFFCVAIESPEDDTED